MANKKLPVDHTPEGLEIRPGYGDLEAIRALFLEYAETLGVDLGFQRFDEECSTLPGDYAPPRGRLFLADYRGKPADCVALRPYGDAACEMKRLFVRPAFRGMKFGLCLIRTAIDAARSMDCPYLVLDTLSTLERSLSLYRGLGFREIEPYYHNPIPGARFFRLDLR